MREAGRILAKTHEELAKNLRPGMSTWDIDHMGRGNHPKLRLHSSFKNYNGYPASICVSVNDEVVHGIPHKEHFLDEVILSVWMQVLSIKDITRMQPGLMASVRSTMMQKTD